MGVIKNLMVRVGTDIRGYRSGMKEAANATSSTSQKIKQNTSGMKKSVGGSFASVGRSIKEYTATVAKTKEDYAVAIQNSERLSDRVQQMRGVYNSVKKATEGLELSKPLNEMVADAENALVQIESKRKKIEVELQSLSNSPRGGNTKKATALQAELDTLAQKSQFAVARLENLNRVADALGANNIGYASAEGLKQLEGQIRSAENELNTSKIITAELGERLKSLSAPAVLGRTIKAIGTNAAHAAKDGVSKLWQKLKGLPRNIVTSIASLPSKLRKIGSSASASCGGLGKMVKSIRNIGIASLGMRVASGMFGRLRSIISSYISQNEELNDTVTAMKNQLGEALLPAINLVLTAMQRMMPVVTALSNGINSILTSLFGNMGKTAAAIKKTADEANSVELYGFDQITKASDSDSSSSASSGTGSSQSGLVQKLTGWIERLKAAFVAGDWRKFGQLIGDGINSVFDSINSIDVGAKIGTFINNVSTALHGLLTTVDFNGIGKKMGQSFTAAIEQVDWNQAGNVIGRAILALPSVLTGFIFGTNWKTVGQGISDCLKSVIATFTDWILATDWLKIGQSAADLIGSINWGGITSNMFKMLGAALGAGVTLLWGFIGDAVTSIRDYFAGKIEEAGGSVAGGLLKGILDGLGNIGSWMTSNITEPFVEGFRGLGNGIVETVEEWINTSIDGINYFFSTLLNGAVLGVQLSNDPQSVSHVSLPRAARGTIVSKATDLTVGEDGTEAVMPLERHTEWMDVLASKLAVKVAGSGSGAKTITLQFILGNRVVTEYVIKDINQITTENGVCPIKL